MHSSRWHLKFPQVCELFFLPIHRFYKGKTRVNGGQNGQKTLNESVTFTSTGTPTIHKKAKKKGKPFLIIFLSSSSWKKQKCLTFGWENSDRKLWNNRLLLRRPLVARPNSTFITCISTSDRAGILKTWVSVFGYILWINGFLT